MKRHVDRAVRAPFVVPEVDAHAFSSAAMRHGRDGPTSLREGTFQRGRRAIGGLKKA